MADKKKGKEQKGGSRSIAQNRKAFHDYVVKERFEAGIALTGTEVKSCRANGVSLVDSYATITRGEVMLLNVHIAPYAFGNRENHEPRRDRKLLMHKREIAQLKKSVEQKGLTLVPLAFYFNERGKVKVELGLCQGKQAHDKREAMKESMDRRDMARAMKR